MLPVLVTGGALPVPPAVPEVLESVEPGVEEAVPCEAVDAGGGATVPCVSAVLVDDCVCVSDAPAPAVLSAAVLPAAVLSAAVVSPAVPGGAALSVVVV